jgi:Uma2 family endonuclease
MANPVPKPATYADVLAAPAHRVAQVLGGTLYTHPRPSPRHSAAASALGGELSTTFQRGNGGPGGWIILDEPELHLGFDIVVPDIAGWRRENLSTLPDTPYLETPPDWVCEILSPSTERLDRGIKRRIYAEAGVKHLWLIDPRSQVLEAFALTGGQWLLVGTAQGGDDVSIAPFDAISFSLAALWPFDLPSQS